MKISFKETWPSKVPKNKKKKVSFKPQSFMYFEYQVNKSGIALVLNLNGCLAQHKNPLIKPRKEHITGI